MLIRRRNELTNPVSANIKREREWEGEKAETDRHRGGKGRD